MPTSDKTLICKFWLQNRCSMRDGCKYAHGEEEKRLACKTIKCQFFASGYCRLGQECLYRHALEEPLGDPSASSDEKEPGSGCEGKSAASTAASDADSPALGPAVIETNSYKRDWQMGKYDKTQQCKFWQEGRCQRGEQCKYAHGEEELRRACGAILCKHLQRSGSCHLGDACWFSHSTMAVNLSDGEPACSTRASTAVPSISSQELASPRRSRHATTDKTLLCKFWLKNKCGRSDCKYAHGEEEKRRACRSILCLFEASGGCRLGSECLYKHSRDRALTRGSEAESLTGDEKEVVDSVEKRATKAESKMRGPSGEVWEATCQQATDSVPREVQRPVRKTSRRQQSETGTCSPGETDSLNSANTAAPSTTAARTPTATGLTSWVTSRQKCWADLNSEDEDEESS